MILDASSLIIFAKIHQLEFLKKLYEKVGIAPEVATEAIQQGLTMGAPDATIIQGALGKVISIISLRDSFRKVTEKIQAAYPHLGKGEGASIALALQEREMLMMDERLGRKVAQLQGIHVYGSLRALLEGFTRQMLGEQEVRNLLTLMMRHNFRVGAEVITEFWNIFETCKKRKKKQ